MQAVRGGGAGGKPRRGSGAQWKAEGRDVRGAGMVWPEAGGVWQ